MEEIWKTVNIGEGYEDSYIVSNLGKIKGLRSGKILKGRSNQKGKGYYKVALYKNKTRKDFYIHRVVAFAFLPMFSGKDEVNHIDGDPSNNTLENLEWCSRQENMKHAFESGLYQDNFKLLESKELIQRLMLEGRSYKDLGKLFGCHPSHINYFALKEGLELPYKRVIEFTEDNLKRAHELLLEGFKFQEIGEIMGFVEETIGRNLKESYGKEYIDKVKNKARNKKRSSIDSPIGVTTHTSKDGEVTYSSRITVVGERMSLGTFNSLKEAVEARNRAENKYWGKESSYIKR